MHRVVLVDDQRSAIRLLALALRNEGYLVDTFHSALEALASVVAAPPDAMVTDIEMPGMTGEELCAEIEQQMPDRAFPIIVVTASTSLHHRGWTRDIDNLTFLEKPVSIRALLKTLDKNCVSPLLSSTGVG